MWLLDQMEILEVVGIRAVNACIVHADNTYGDLPITNQSIRIPLSLDGVRGRVEPTDNLVM